MHLLLPAIFCSALTQAPPVPALQQVQIVMDEASIIGGQFKIGATDLLEPLAEMYRKAGFTVLPAKGPLPPDALQLRFTVAAIHDKQGRVAYQVFGRLSEGRDAKLKENPAGQPQRVWFASITAGRSGFAEGVSELHATLASISTLLYRMSAKATGKWPATVNFPVTFPPPPESTRINMSEVQNVSPLKVKTQGLCPPWPKLAVERKLKGTVTVEVIVGEDGKPLRAYVKQGPAEFHLHSIQWALGYEFEPAKVNDKPVKVKFLLPLNYQEPVVE